MKRSKSLPNNVLPVSRVHCGADLNGGNRCKCGKVHTGPFAWLIKFFHSIQYFFKNLFK